MRGKSVKFESTKARLACRLTLGAAQRNCMALMYGAVADPNRTERDDLFAVSRKEGKK
jgi:hypothetical protein